ncbi:MAG TPA: DUF4936 family protein [Burkholderiales bacterium]
MAFSYYIYYRVAQAGAASVAVRKLQSAIQERFGIEGRVLTKRDEPCLWMEIYEGVSDGAAFEACLAELVGRMDFSANLAPGSKRQIECFEEPRCA